LITRGIKENKRKERGIIKEKKGESMGIEEE